MVVAFQHLTILSVLLCTLALSSLAAAAVEFTKIVNGSPVEAIRLLLPSKLPEVAALEDAAVEVDTVVAASTTTVDGDAVVGPTLDVNAFSSSEGPRIMQHTRFTISRLITNRFAVVRRLGVTQKAPSARIFTPIELTSNPPTRQSTANIVEFHFSSSPQPVVSSFFFRKLDLLMFCRTVHQRRNWYRSFIVSSLRLSHSFLSSVETPKRTICTDLLLFAVALCGSSSISTDKNLFCSWILPELLSQLAIIRWAELVSSRTFCSLHQLIFTRTPAQSIRITRRIISSMYPSTVSRKHLLVARQSSAE